MQEAKQKKKPKATVSVDVICPCCEKKLTVNAWRIRTNESVKAEYRVDTEVIPVVQGTFPTMEDTAEQAEIHG